MIEKHSSLSIVCRYCQKTFIASYRQRNKLYCSKDCQSKSNSDSKVHEKSECVICKKDFKHYGSRIVCSRKCNAKYLNNLRINKKNIFISKNNEYRFCLFCNKLLNKDCPRSFCSLACAHNIEFPQEQTFLDENSIRERDNFECQLCGTKDKCVIHYIDNDKSNLDKENLISLCKKCVDFTNKDRTFWEIVFSCLISGSTIAKKSWGLEVHLVNHNEYCLKYLIFFKDKQFSYHWHPLKKELWHCLRGKFECVLEKSNGDKDYFFFKQGDKIEVLPTVKHQLQAMKNSILVEVSTRDYAEDSIRDIEGKNF